MNKEQVKHLADVIKEIATGQFLFLGGKNLFIYAKSNDFDWVLLGLAGVIYLSAHAIIHAVLWKTED